MSGSMRALRLAAAALVVAGGLIVASCGGGSVNTTPVASATSAPVTQSVPTGGGALTVASSTTQVATFTFAAGAPSNVSLSATSSTTAPASAPVPSSVKRAADAVTGAVPFFYVTFSVSANLSTQFISAQSVSLTGSDPATASYFVEFDDITAAPATKLGTTGPVTAANGIATFLSGGQASGSQTLSAGHTYLAQFYFVPAAAGPSPSASPSTAPSSNPSASPSPSPSATATTAGGFTFSGGSDNTGSASNCTTTFCEPLAPPGPPFATTVTFGNASGPVELFVALASGVNPSSQISPSASFPYFTGTGTVEEYLQLSGSTNVTFAQTPSVTVHGLTAVTGCTFYTFTSGSIWAQVSPPTGSASVLSGSVTMPMAAGVGGNGVPNSNPVNVGPTPAYGAVVCS
jgi:hypothetical protein